MPTSQRKRRQAGRQPPGESEVEKRLARLVAERPGVACETEMAGDWNSLGIFLTVPADHSREQVIELRNAAVELLAGARAELELSFEWSGGIYRDGELLEAFSPGSQPVRLCPVCGKAQEEWLGPICVSCKTPGLW